MCFTTYNLITYQNTTVEKTNWKQQTLPLARIKKIMKSEEVIYAAERELKQEPDSSAEDMSTQVYPFSKRPF